MINMRRKICSIVLAVCMLLPVMSMPVSADAVEPVKSENAGKAIAVDIINGYKIGNTSVPAQNVTQAFFSDAGKNGSKGFLYSESEGGDSRKEINDNETTDFQYHDKSATMTIDVSKNPTLKAVAEGGNGQFKIQYKRTSDHYTYYDWGKKHHYQDSYLKITVKNGSSTNTLVDSEYSEGNSTSELKTHDWQTFSSNTIIEIYVWGDDYKNSFSDRYVGIVEFGIYFKDDTAPTATYASTNTGTVNSKNSDELLVKLGSAVQDYDNDPDNRYSSTNLTDKSQEYVDMKFSFSEPVQAEEAALARVSGGNSVDKTALNNAETALKTAQSNYNTALNAQSEANLANKAAQAVVDSATQAQEVTEDILGCFTDENINAKTAVQNAIDKLESYTGGETTIAALVLEAARSEAERVNTNDDPDFVTPTEISVRDKAMPVAIEQVKSAAESMAESYANGATNIKEAASATAQAARDAEASVTQNVIDAAQNKMDTYYPGATTEQNNAVITANSSLTQAESEYNTAYNNYQNALDAAAQTALNSLVNSGIGSIGALTGHMLFTNTLGTGYMGSGQNRGLELYSCKDTDNRTFVTEKRKYVASGSANVKSAAEMATMRIRDLSYRYSARRGDYNGNNAIAYGGGIESRGNYALTDANGAVTTLLDKLNNAGFHDAAGNPLIFSAGNGVNPFDLSDGGKNVIVDAEPPTYTRVGNGITPEVLTGLVLNKNDNVDFTVGFSEAVIAKRSLGNDSGIYILFNNDDRAEFVKKSADGKQWTFNRIIGENASEANKLPETPLWKAIALTHTSLDGQLNAGASGYDFAKDADGRAITDYVGNILADRANLDSSSPGNTQQVESSTAWAELAVDNTAPSLSFEYEKYSESLTESTDSKWGQAGRIIVNASDPTIKMPSHDPLEPNAVKVSKGIYRPQNMTGGSAEQSPASGLFFYTWTQSATAPAVGENFEAIKRYSLSGIQPKEVTGKDYASEWNGCTLRLANNTDSIVPLDEAIDGTKNGVWYLHVWTADMTWDSARQLMQYELMSGLKFKPGYDQAAYNKKKQELIDEYRDDNTVNTGTLDDEGFPIYETPTYDEAWAVESVKQAAYTAAYTPAFIAWLDDFATKNGKSRYSDDAMSYANTEAMTVVGAYGETSVSVGAVITNTWTLDKFNKEDSNWISGTKSILFDNAAPSAVFDNDNTVGNDTAMVNVPFNVSDLHSGIDAHNGNDPKIWYQWVKKSGTTPPDALAWSEVAAIRATGITSVKPETGSPMTGASSVKATATTLSNVTDDGEYYLLVKATDDAGNSSVSVSGFTIKVNSTRAALCEFGAAGQDSVPSGYVRSIIPTALVTGVEIKEVSYIVDSSIATPTSGYNVLTATVTTSSSIKSYAIPELKAPDRADGTWYVHIKVVEDAADPNAEPYYFRQAYNLDNTPPVVYLSSNGASLPKDSFDITVTANDALAGISEATTQEAFTLEALKSYKDVLYMWVAQGDSAPTTETTIGWKELPETGTARLDSSYLEGSDPVKTFTLYAKATDIAGNTALSNSTGTFTLTGVESEEKPPTNYGSQLITVYERDDRVYASASLTLGVEDKAGYRYSLSTDGGETWCNWLPFMSFVEILLPVDSLDLTEIQELDLEVRFKAPGGTLGDAANITTAAVSTDEGLYATAQFDSMKARKDGIPLTFIISKPDGVEVTPTGTAVSTTGANFSVTQNGVYTFEVNYEDEPVETPNILTIVVDIYDNIAPIGDAMLSTAFPTNANVTATLETSEPVRVTKIVKNSIELTGAKNYIFTENGQAVFHFEDEAGNTGSAIAIVNNIDRTPPNVRVTRSYIYGDNGEKTFGTLGTGPNLVAQGMLLTLEKASINDKEFTVISGDGAKSRTVTENGTYNFTVADKMGNTRTVSEKAINIINELPAHNITYEFVNSDGTTLEDSKITTIGGIAYARADVKVTISIPKSEVKGADNAIYSGIQKVERTIPQPKIVAGAAVLDENGDIVYENKYITNKLTESSGNYIYTRTYTANGSIIVPLCDGLGNTERIPVTITGIDKKGPDITLSKESVSIVSGTEIINTGTEGKTANFMEKLGGFTVSDNVSAAENVTVRLDSVPDTSYVGRRTVIYIATDEMGNETRLEQKVYVLPIDGLLVLADGTLLSGAASESSILPDNKVYFEVDDERMQQMGFQNYGVTSSAAMVRNTAMRYDIYYVSGLYREGQLKYIASQITSEELTETAFNFTFDKPGWYTIIIRNQERTREYTTFFISSIESD